MKRFESEEKCEDYILKALLTETIVLIASTVLAKNVVHSVHQQCQLAIMFVYDTTKQSDNRWVSKYKKVKTVKLDMLEKHTKLFWHRWLRNSSKDFLSMNIFNMEKIAVECSSTDINGTFLSSRLFLDILIKVKPSPTDKDKFVRTCARLCKGSIEQIAILKEFNLRYREEDAFEWYTQNSVIYRRLNQALRVQNIDFLILSRFCIRDLQSQIKQHRCVRPVHVYRGQLMSKTELSHLRQSSGQFISINSFLSTSLSRDVALFFLGITDVNASQAQNGLEYVLFEIDADPNLSGGVSAFANIADFSVFDEEEEILFALGSVFRLNDVRPDSNNQYLSIVSLTLCGNDDHELKPVFDFMKEEYQKDDPATNIDSGDLTLNSLGIVLLNMGHFGAAERFFHRMLRTLQSKPISVDVATCYRYIGDVYRQKNRFKTSRKWYRKALAMYAHVSPNDDAFVAATYMCLGHAYSKTTDWKFSTWYQTDFASKYYTRGKQRRLQS
jgi:tetratricopeptide (TPR) repeat protein